MKKLKSLLILLSALFLLVIFSNSPKDVLAFDELRCPHPPDYYEKMTCKFSTRQCINFPFMDCQDVWDR